MKVIPLCLLGMSQFLVIPISIACECGESPLPQSPPNVIMEPAYVHFNDESTEKPSPPIKLQYLPVTSEMPLLIENNAPREISNGAEYEEGTDVYVTQKPTEEATSQAINDPPSEPPVQQ